MTREYFKNPYRRKKKTISTTKSYEFECRCCKQLFISQGRFSNKDVRYKHYCSACRKVCLMCRCRHGNRGNTCSKYCADRYKKLCWHWKLNNPKNTKTKLNTILSEFNLSLINKDILRPLFGIETIYIQSRSIEIKKTMLLLQDMKKINSTGNKLIINPSLYLYKNTFYLFKQDKREGRIENHIKNIKSQLVIQQV
jgi:hypothetical protein